MGLYWKGVSVTSICKRESNVTVTRPSGASPTRPSPDLQEWIRDCHWTYVQTWSYSTELQHDYAEHSYMYINDRMTQPNWEAEHITTGDGFENDVLRVVKQICRQCPAKFWNRSNCSVQSVPLKHCAVKSLGANLNQTIPFLHWCTVNPLLS